MNPIEHPCTLDLSNPADTLSPDRYTGTPVKERNEDLLLALYTRLDTELPGTGTGTGFCNWILALDIAFVLTESRTEAEEQNQENLQQLSIISVFLHSKPPALHSVPEHTFAGTDCISLHNHLLSHRQFTHTHNGTHHGQSDIIERKHPILQHGHNDAD